MKDYLCKCYLHKMIFSVTREKYLPAADFPHPLQPQTSQSCAIIERNSVQIIYIKGKIRKDSYASHEKHTMREQSRIGFVGITVL